MAMAKPIGITEAEYRALCSDSGGICTECGETNYGIEPDAHGYPCEVCGNNTVVGIEDCLLLGVIKLVAHHRNRT